MNPWRVIFRFMPFSIREIHVGVFGFSHNRYVEEAEKFSCNARKSAWKLVSVWSKKKMLEQDQRARGRSKSDIQEREEEARPKSQRKK
ncbi:unnamed protein product [Citrullus colocynthis]|uniref:Uncharacterized protein n=1 Tax=Citrullus colocynthis TaxID=252529 RepID=A0ABP0Y9P8_9ROSI